MVAFRIAPRGETTGEPGCMSENEERRSVGGQVEKQTDDARRR